MIVTGYSSGMVECRWYDGTGSSGKLFMKPSLFQGRGVACGRSLKGYH